MGVTKKDISAVEELIHEVSGKLDAENRVLENVAAPVADGDAVNNSTLRTTVKDLVIISGLNIASETTYKEGFYIDNLGVEKTISDVKFKVTDYIELKGLSAMQYVGYLWQSTYVYFYDVSKAPISGYTYTDPDHTTVNLESPEGAVYIKASTHADFSSEVKILASEKIPIIEKKVSENFDLAIASYKKIGEDLAENTTYTEDTWLNSIGFKKTASGFKITDYVKTFGATNIIYKGLLASSTFVCYYDKDKTFLSSQEETDDLSRNRVVLAIPPNTEYIRATTTSSAVVLELGEHVNMVEFSIEDLNAKFTTENSINIVDREYLDDNINKGINPSLPFNEISPTGYSRLDFTPCNENEKWTAFDTTHGVTNRIEHIFFYDVDKTPISMVDAITLPLSKNKIEGARVFTTPVNAAFFRANIKDYDTAQLSIMIELGEYKNEYVEGGSRTTFKEETIPNVLLEDLNVVKNRVAALEIPNPSSLVNRTYHDEKSKYSLFTNHFLKKDRDVAICITGTSLSRGSYWASNHLNAATRPPACHTNDLCSNIWDKVAGYWKGQEYRRYDSNFFIENGTFRTTNDEPEWDDNTVYKDPLTRLTSEANASVSFMIPVNAWQFNFIYKTDSIGDNCTISVSEGNGVLQVLDRLDDTWKEANGFNLPMLEPGATATKGNTCYQKRLKMRCKEIGGFDSRNTVKNVTITKSSDTAKRIMYWGVEWSIRQYMITLINSSRGSMNWGNAGSLETLQDTDIWEFEPILLLAEVTTHNWSGSTRSSIHLGTDRYINLVKEWYFNEGVVNNPNSIKARSGNFIDCNVVFYNDTMNGLLSADGAYNADGSLSFEEITASGDSRFGDMSSCYDNYDAVSSYMNSHISEVVYIEINNVFREVSEKLYGSHQAGMLGSGVDGSTLSKDSTHWNDNGVKIVSKLLTPLFDL